MRRLLFTLISLGCALALAGTVYKWVDENGVVHYSDQPHANAQKLQLQSAQTYRAQPGGNSAPAAEPAVSPAATPSAYLGCAVVQPSDEQAFTNVDSLTVVVQTDPGLRPGDQIQATLDGQPLAGNGSSPGTFTISPVDRGTHTLQAVVRDGAGAIQCQTPVITFYVHQPSILNPANPVRPR